jgi:hypothetical protein
MRMLPRIAGSLLVASMLAGCFSMEIRDNIDNAGKNLQSTYGKALDWGEFTGPRQLTCQQVCSDSIPAWRVDLSDSVLYLRLLRDEALLTDSLPRCLPVPDGRTMELVITDTPMDFHPSDSAGRSTALLQLKLRRGAPWSSSALAMQQGSSLLFLREDSVVRLPFNILRHPVRPKDVRTAQIRAGIPLILTIPLDVVTSPFQLLTAWIWIQGVKGQKH